jgi:uncharacterized protein YggE
MTTRKRISVIAILMALASGVLAPASEAAAIRYVTVSAQGTVKVVPDAVRINATATTVAASNKEALATTAKTAAAVRAALKDIAIQNVSVYPEYKYNTDGTSALVGYRASQAFTITVRAADTAGSIVDSLITAGGDNLQINGATPFILDSTQSLEAARTAAVKSAKAKATSYAKLLGVKLGKVNYLVENSAPTNYTPVMGVAKAESDATVIDLGQQDVTISVTVQWSLG